jgi:catechol 2,3-dioxygenase-like lactoylglutathione lyase family enzyme
MKLVHVNLRVRNPNASADFYVRALLPGATSSWLGESLHVRSEGVDLAFSQGEPVIASGSHHGFLAPSRDAVDAARDVLGRLGVPLTDDCSETDFRSIKFRDPDGYECEVYWEP